MGTTTTIDRRGLDALMLQVQALKRVRVEYGIPSPSPPHLGRPDKPAREGLTAAQVLAFIEFGTNGPKPRAAPKAAKPARARGGGFARFGRKLLRGFKRFGRALLKKLMSGFRSRAKGGGSVPAKTPEPQPEKARPARPIVRWVAQAKRGEMQAMVRQVAHAVATGHDPAPRLERLRSALAEWTRARIIDVGAVDTGQTRDAITAVVRHR